MSSTDDQTMGIFAPALGEELNISAERNIYQVSTAFADTDGSLRKLFICNHSIGGGFARCDRSLPKLFVWRSSLLSIYV